MLTCSALTMVNIADVWTCIDTHQRQMTQNGQRLHRRQQQQLDWFRSYLRQRLESRFFGQSAMASRLARVEAQVLAGTLLPIPAVDSLFA